MKKFNEGWNPFNKSNEKEITNGFNHAKAIDGVNAVAIEFEKTPEFRRIQQLFEKNAIKKAKKIENVGYWNKDKYKVVLNDGTNVVLFDMVSLGLGEDGFDQNGDYINVYKIIINNNPLSGWDKIKQKLDISDDIENPSYITGETYSKFEEIINNYLDF